MAREEMLFQHPGSCEAEAADFTFRLQSLMNRSDVTIHLWLTLESLSANIAYVNDIVVGVAAVLSEVSKSLEHLMALTTHEICNDQTSFKFRFAPSKSSNVR